MKYRQFGFGGFQLLMVIVVIGAISVVAVPKYESYMVKAKLTEAFNLAGESKRKISQYYMVNGRFPRTTREAEPLATTTLSEPEFVSFMEVQPEADDHAIVVKVYLKKDVVENTGGGDQYIYVAGDLANTSNASVEWSCGANGVDVSLLPEGCKG